MTDPFVSNAANALPYAPSIAAAVSQAGADISSEEESKQKPARESFEPSPNNVTDWQPNESDLLPGFGVGRARELIQWLINLELRLPPYTEVSPA